MIQRPPPPTNAARLALALSMLLAPMLYLAAPAHASATVAILSSSSYVDSIDYLHVVGEVRNAGSTNVEFVHLTVTYHDAADRLLAAGDAYSSLDVLAPGEKSPFHGLEDAPQDYDHYKLSVSARETSEIPNHNFTTEVTNEYTDSIGYRHLVGTVRNNNRTRSEYVEPVITLYDANGTVVDTDFTYVKSDDSSSLEAQATAPFEFLISSRQASSSYVVVTESSTPPAFDGAAPPASPSPTATTSPTTPSRQPTPTPTATPITTASPASTPTAEPTPGAVVARLAGPERLSTGISISKNAWDSQQAQSVVLARSDAFPDALAGTPLAVRRAAPLLLTPPSALNSNVANEIKRVLPAGRTVYLLGGTAAISTSVGDAVTRLGYRVVRLSGPDRYATAVTISKQLGTPSTIFLATGLSFQNALISGVAAAGSNGVVVLTADAKMPAVTRSYLNSFAGVERVAVGPQATAADPGATAVTGSSVYDTSRLLAERYFAAPDSVAVASGTVFADALAGGAHIGRLGGPLLLSAPTSLPAPVGSYLSANQASIDTATLYGGTAALSADVEDSVRGRLRQ